MGFHGYWVITGVFVYSRYFLKLSPNRGRDKRLLPFRHMPHGINQVHRNGLPEVVE